jgi:Fe2+ transport system protein B
MSAAEESGFLTFISQPFLLAFKLIYLPCILTLIMLLSHYNASVK